VEGKYLDVSGGRILRKKHLEPVDVVFVDTKPIAAS